MYPLYDKNRAKRSLEFFDLPAGFDEGAKEPLFDNCGSVIALPTLSAGVLTVIDEPEVPHALL